MGDYFGDLVPVIGIAAVVTLLTTPFFRWLSFRVDAVVKPDERRVHTEPTALLGGAAILLGFLAGSTLVGTVAVALAVAAAFLNAAFGFCLGCEMYLLLRRAAPVRASV